MTDPSYRDNAAPPPPPAPPRFSPLRPLKRAVWWLLTAQALPPLAEVRHGEFPFGSFMLAFILWAFIALVASCYYFVPAGDVATKRAALWTLVVCCALPLIRLWLRSAMRLDEPETRAWWEERFR